MFKRILLILVLILVTNSFAIAQDIPVKLEALNEISTSNVNLQEGDEIALVVQQDVYNGSKLYIKRGAVASGVITSLVDNGFTCQEASIYAENFKVKLPHGKVVKLKGIVYKKGRNHSLFTQFLPIAYEFIRGGEAKIIPKQDVFTLYAEGGKVDDL